MSKKEAKYIPAFRFGWLTKLFDPFIRWTMPELTFKYDLIENARLTENMRVLDLGCGTATLTILIKKTHPEVEVIGLDGDPKIIEIARGKVFEAGLDISLDHGMAFALPYPDNSFDRVFSSLMFHHLTLENKKFTLQEVYRVLKPGGEIHIADFGKPQGTLMYLISLIMRRFEETADNFKGLLPELISYAGFEQVEENSSYKTIFSTVTLYSAGKAGVK